MKNLILFLITVYASIFMMYGEINTNFANTQSLADIKLQAIVETQNALLTQLQSNPEYYSEIEKERRFIDLFKEYEEFILNNPNYIHADILYGKLLRQAGLTKKAYRVFLNANKKDPNIAVIQQQIGNFLAEEGEYALALNHFLQAIELEPKEAIYHYQLGELLHRYKKSFLAANILSEDKFDHQMLNAFCKARELGNDSWVYQVRYAEAFYDVNKPRWDDALILWKNLEDQAPNTVEKEIVFLNQARIQIKKKEYKQAKECLAKVYSPSLEKSRRELLELIPIDS